ncbi:MAG: hypothetical protein O2955_09515 [Planctomycetota bacterium]|nr:hypothetical protein [Planctomycetota bacterium]MDA1212747.1 hypothetical protein [Planctomycetota bacterium]
MSYSESRTVLPSLMTSHDSNSVAFLTAGEDEHRCARLKDQLQLLGDHLTDVDLWIERFVQRVTAAEYDSGSSDAERFLEWLRQYRRLSVSENDAVCCQSARFAVATMVKLNPTRHLRFQELRTMSQEFKRDLNRLPKLWFVVNPIHVWTTLRSSAMLHDAEVLPAQVIFYPVQDEVCHAVVTSLGQQLLRHLSETGACRGDDLLAVCRDESPLDLLNVCRELMSLGLVSLG